MNGKSKFVAVDLGASNGRVLVAGWDGARFQLREVHRFGNGPVEVLGRLHWDVLGLWSEIRNGLARASAGGRPASIGVDAWGVDFALLDSAGALLSNPRHYRDPRTAGAPDRAYRIVAPETLYAVTGVQTMAINTLFQLFVMAESRDPQLDAAAILLPIPNLFSYWLGAEGIAEYTHATTTQCLDARARTWADDLLGRLGIPSRIFPPLVAPGTVLGPVRAGVAADLGSGPPPRIVAVACHDTASAVGAIPGLDPASAFISSGTWSLMGVELAVPVITDEARRAGFTNEGGLAGTTRFQKNLAGLWLVQECRRQWRQEGLDREWDELLALAAVAEPFGAIVDPDAPELLAPPDMPAAIRAACTRSGQRPPDGVGAIIRCCLESLVLRYRATLEDLERLLGRRIEVVRVVGGGSRNRLLCQLTADACGRPVVAGPAEATAMGNVMVQAIATDELDDVAAGRAAIAASIDLDTYLPRPGGAWDAGLARQRALSEGVRA